MEQHLRMREAAEQHGRPTVPVSGLYFRMEDHDHTKRFKNHMRLKLLGIVAWLEFPTRKRRRQFVLPLSPDGEDAIRIDWSPAYPEWKSGRLQLVVEEGERGIREKEEVFWKLHTEYSQEEVEKHLEAARSSSRSGSPVAMLMDGELTDEDVAVSSTSCKRQKIALASTPAAAGTGQGSEEEKMLLNIQRVLYINLARRPDRRAQVIRELQSLRIPEDKVIRIEAVDAEESREKAIVSCCRSHIAALECAMRNGWDEVLILEDDFKLVHSAERTKARWAHFRDMVPTYQVASWAHNCLRTMGGPHDIQMLGGDDAGVARVRYLQTASAYAVRHSAMAELKSTYEDAIARDRPFDRHMTRITGNVEWFAFVPALSIQRASFSDIEHRHVNYGC
jgi:glycosyl transferase family 25